MGKEGGGEGSGLKRTARPGDDLFSVTLALAHDRLLSRTVSVELQQNEVSIVCAHTLRRAYSLQGIVTTAVPDSDTSSIRIYANQPLAYIR